MYALISLPIPNGAWQEYVLIGTSLAMTIFSLKEKIDFEKTKLYRIVAITIIFLGAYGIIFYLFSDWSILEATSLFILCVAPLVNFVQSLMQHRKK